MLLYSMIDWAKRWYVTPLGEQSEQIKEWMNWLPEYVRGEGWNATQAWLSLINRVTRNYEKPLWNVHKEDGSVLQEEVVWKKDVFGQVLWFKNEPDRSNILIVTPYSGHYGTLLRDTVETLAKQHNVYVLEWNNVRDIPVSAGDFSLDDYVDQVIGAITFLKEKGRKVHVMSVCQPTVPVLIASSLMKQRGLEGPDNLIMIGGPIDARKSPTATNNFALDHDLNWFKQRLIHLVPMSYKGAGRLVYPGFMQYMGFVAMNPSRHVDAHKDFFKNLMKGDDRGAQKHKDFYDEYNAVMDLPAAYYLQTIEKVFQRFDLAEGKFYYRDEELVTPGVLDCALMTLEGELDDISGSGQTHSAQALCSGVPAVKRKEMTAQGVGHYGVFSGSKFETQIAPEITAWILKQEKSKNK